MNDSVSNPLFMAKETYLLVNTINLVGYVCLCACLCISVYTHVCMSAYTYFHLSIFKIPWNECAFHLPILVKTLLPFCINYLDYLKISLGTLQKSAVSGICPTVTNLLKNIFWSSLIK